MAAHAGAGRRARRQQGSADRRGTRRRRQACRRPRRDGPRRERQDPGLPQGQGAAARAQAAHREGAPVRGGGREPHRRLVLERGCADAHPPGRAARVRLRASRRRGEPTGSFTATVAVQAEARAAGLERRSRCPPPSPRFRPSWSSRRCTHLQETAADLSPVDGPPGATRRRPRPRSRDARTTRDATTASSSAADASRPSSRRRSSGVSAGDARRSRFPCRKARRAPSR